MACFVYVAESAGRVKIGMSNSPKQRMGSLSTATADDVVLHHQWKLPSRAAAERMEGDLHRLFRRSRIRREWFSVSPYDVVGVGDSLIARDREEAERRLRIYRQCAAFKANWQRRARNPSLQRHVAKSQELFRVAMKRLVLAGLSRNEWDEVYLD